MGEKLTFEVVRRHIGDRDYDRGDTREGTMADLGHLVPHVLQPLDSKADASLDNKAEGAAPANKAAKGRKAKTKADEADQGDEA